MQRILELTAANLDVTFYADETATSADGAVTVNIVKGDGSTLISSGSTTNPSTGTYRYVLTAANNTELQDLTLTWSGVFGGQAQSLVTNVEVVGGFFFSLAEGRAADSSLASTSSYTTAQLRDYRNEVEDEFERICNVSFVPRYHRTRLSGSGCPVVYIPRDRPHTKLRAIRSVRIYSDATNYTTFSTDELALCTFTDGGRIERLDGGIFTAGRQNIVIEYEHGFDQPPLDIKRAAMMRLRYRANLSRGGVPDRATSYQVDGGGVFRLDQAGAWKTGIPEIDGPLARWSYRLPMVG